MKELSKLKNRMEKLSSRKRLIAEFNTKFDQLLFWLENHKHIPVSEDEYASRLTNRLIEIHTSVFSYRRKDPALRFLRELLNNKPAR